MAWKDKGWAWTDRDGPRQIKMVLDRYVWAWTDQDGPEQIYGWNWTDKDGPGQL